MGHVYLTEVPNLGDAGNVAAHRFAHDVESFLHNDAHPGHRNLAFLDWSHGRYLATKQSSGLIPGQVEWDPAAASVKADGRELNGPHGFADRGLRYSDAAVADDSIDTSADVQGSVLKAADFGYDEDIAVVTDPNMARFYNGQVRVVNLSVADGVPTHEWVGDKLVPIAELEAEKPKAKVAAKLEADA